MKDALRRPSCVPPRGGSSASFQRRLEKTAAMSERLSAVTSERGTNSYLSVVADNLARAEAVIRGVKKLPAWSDSQLSPLACLCLVEGL